jgi:hypothetical protein
VTPPLLSSRRPAMTGATPSLLFSPAQGNLLHGVLSSPLPPDLHGKLDLQPCLDLQSDIWLKCRKPVGCSKAFSLREFFLVASFGRCKFQLNSDIVRFLLQSALGGSALDFHVIQISEPSVSQFLAVRLDF